MKLTTEGLFVRLAIVAALIWIVVSIIEITGETETLKGVLDLVALAVLGVVVILGIGLGAQSLADYIARKRE